MRIFKSKSFAKFAQKENISDSPYAVKSELFYFKNYAKEVFSFSDFDLNEAVKHGAFEEIKYE